MALSCRIVHAIAGRTRLRLPALHTDPVVALHLVTYLSAQPGILAVSVTPACESLVVYAEPTRWTAAALGQWITALSPETLAAIQAHPPAVSASPSPADASWWALSMASLAVAASLLSIPTVPFLLPLYVGAAWPLLTRTVQAWREGPRLTADLTDVTATALLAWQGQWVPAAALLWLEHCSAMLHDIAQQRATLTTAAVAPRPWFPPQAGTTIVATQIQEEARQWADAVRPARTALAAAVGLGSGNAAQAAAVLVAGHATGMQRVAPMTILTTMVQSAQQGVRLPTGRQIEALARVDAVVLDTAVPFTQRIPDITRVLSYRHQFSSDQILALAAATQQPNPHPVAQAVLWEAQARTLELPAITMVGSPHGLNVEARLEETTIHVGTDVFLQQQAIPLTQRAQRDVQRLAQRANGVLYVAMDGRLCGLVAYTDPWRPDLAEIMQALQTQGVREIVLVAEQPAQVPWTSAALSTVVRFDPAWSPADKMHILHRLHAAGATVAVVSEAPNIAVWSTVDVAIILQDTAAMTQASPETVTAATLAQVPLALGMARDTMTFMHRQWHSLTVVYTLSVLLASVGGIGPLGALGLSKGVPLLALGRVLYPR